jgi:hypothetical protein
MPTRFAQSSLFSSSLVWCPSPVARRIDLSRNLGLITGASLMGAVFALASATTDITTAPPAAIATGMKVTFAVATMLILMALAIALATRARSPAQKFCARRPQRVTFRLHAGYCWGTPCT